MGIKLTYDDGDMTIHPPSIYFNLLRWHLREPSFPLMTFTVHASAFKIALGLRPRARADERLAIQIAQKNWDVLEAIGRDAMRCGDGMNVEDYKMRELKHRISDDLFDELFEKYESRFVR